MRHEKQCLARVTEQPEIGSSAFRLKGPHALPTRVLDPEIYQLFSFNLENTLFSNPLLTWIHRGFCLKMG